MSEGNIPIDYNFRNIRRRRNQVSKKTNYDKMTFITFLSFTSTRLLMACFLVDMFDRKLASSQIKYVFNYYCVKY